MAYAARLKGLRDQSTIYTPSSPASWSSASSKPTSTSMLTRAKARGSANRFSICDPCCRCIPKSSPSWLARIRIFRILVGEEVIAVCTGIHDGPALKCGLSERPQVAIARSANLDAVASGLAAGVTGGRPVAQTGGRVFLVAATLHDTLGV